MKEMPNLVGTTVIPRLRKRCAAARHTRRGRRRGVATQDAQHGGMRPAWPAAGSIPGPPSSPHPRPTCVVRRHIGLAGLKARRGHHLVPAPLRLTAHEGLSKRRHVALLKGFVRGSWRKGGSRLTNHEVAEPAGRGGRRGRQAAAAVLSPPQSSVACLPAASYARAHPPPHTHTLFTRSHPPLVTRSHPRTLYMFSRLISSTGRPRVRAMRSITISATTMPCSDAAGGASEAHTGRGARESGRQARAQAAAGTTWGRHARRRGPSQRCGGRAPSRPTRAPAAPQTRGRRCARGGWWRRSCRRRAARASGTRSRSASARGP